MSVKVRKECDHCGTSMETEVVDVIKQARGGCSCGCGDTPTFTVLSKPPKQ